jgi:hypothetical protein
MKLKEKLAEDYASRDAETAFGRILYDEREYNAYLAGFEKAREIASKDFLDEGWDISVERLSRLGEEEVNE